MSLIVEQKANKMLDKIASNQWLSDFVDFQLPIPQVYRGTDTIRLIILGQDPTVKNTRSRAAITTVLNLNKAGSLYNYLVRIFNSLELCLEENIYATNYLKNFFRNPPTQIKEIDIFKEFSTYWLPLLKEELVQFPQVPIISLGQPLLSAIVNSGASPRVRDYWGYMPNWKAGEKSTYCFLESDKNILERVVFPFPHQPSVGKRFYTERFNDYVAFMRRQLDTK